MDDLKKQSNAPVVRVFEILLGVAPATMVATYSVFVLLKGLEELSQSDPTGLLMLGWFGLGIAGTIGLWLAAFRVGDEPGRAQTVLLWLLAAGIGGVAVTGAAVYPTDEMRPFPDASVIVVWLLPLSGPLVVAIWHFVRQRRLTVGLTALVMPAVAFAYVVAAPLYWSTVSIERTIEWQCGYAAGCDPDADAWDRYIQYNFVEDNTGYQFQLIDGLLEHLERQPTTAMPVKLDVRTWFGRFQYFWIREIAGFVIERDTRNPNQPKPPFPDPELDQHVFGEQP